MNVIKRDPPKTGRIPCKPTERVPHMRTGMLVAMCAAVSLTALPAQAQFAIADHPRVNPADFIVTKFSDDLNYPVGMVELEDGSVPVAASDSDCNSNTLYGYMWPQQRQRILLRKHVGADLTLRRYR